MKEGKGSYLAMLWLLIGSLCLGVLLLLLAPREERVSASENRMLAGAPELNRESLMSGAFSTGVEDFLIDGFFQRDQVINTADELLGVFDLRTEEQRLIQQEAEVNRKLTEDASEPDMTADDEESSAVAEEPTASPEPSPAPTAETTAAPTPTPTAAPTPTPSPTPSPSPAPTCTPAPTSEATATPPPSTPEATATHAPEPTPYATMTPAPTATPKVIVPLEADALYVLNLIRSEDDIIQVYDYPSENIMNFAGSLNYLKGLLPEDGEIHYLQVPVASVANRLSTKRSQFIGWESTMEDALQSQVENGIYIHNVPAILNDHLAARETDLFYFTDHHWSGKGAWYTVKAIMQRRGVPVVGYDEYQYQRKIMGKDESGYEDWIEAMYPLAPVRSVIISKLDQERESLLINYKVSNYIAYLNGTETPWRRIDTGYGTDRRALVICDSFGNAFVPYLLPYYGEVHMTDLRYSYFDEYDAGGTFAELMAYHRIDDIYVVLSTSNGVNSPNSQKVFWQAITK